MGRSKKGCSFCRGDVEIATSTSTGLYIAARAFSYAKGIYCTAEDKESRYRYRIGIIRIQMNFCPVCGKRIKDIKNMEEQIDGRIREQEQHAPKAGELPA